MSETIKRTFDDGHGNHALVYLDGSDNRAPEFGRTDVMHVIPLRLHPTRARADYVGLHRLVLTVDEVKSLAESWDWAHGSSGNCTLLDEGGCEGCDERDRIEAFVGGVPMSDGSIA